MKITISKFSEGDRVVMRNPRPGVYGGTVNHCLPEMHQGRVIGFTYIVTFTECRFGRRISNSMKVSEEELSMES